VEFIIADLPLKHKTKFRKLFIFGQSAKVNKNCQSAKFNLINAISCFFIKLHKISTTRILISLNKFHRSFGENTFILQNKFHVYVKISQSANFRKNGQSTKISSTKYDFFVLVGSK